MGAKSPARPRPNVTNVLDAVRAAARAAHSCTSALAEARDARTTTGRAKPLGHYPPDISNISNISDICIHMFCCLTYHFGDISNIFHSHMFWTYVKKCLHMYWNMWTYVWSYVNMVYIIIIWQYISQNSLTYVEGYVGSSNIADICCSYSTYTFDICINPYKMTFQICQTCIYLTHMSHHTLFEKICQHTVLHMLIPCCIFFTYVNTWWH